MLKALRWTAKALPGATLALVGFVAQVGPGEARGNVATWLATIGAPFGLSPAAVFAVLSLAVVLFYLWLYRAEQRAKEPPPVTAFFGPDTRRRENQAGLAPLITEGQALREAVPFASHLTQQADVAAWKERVEKWRDRTEAFLIQRSPSAAVRFSDMANLQGLHIPKIHQEVHTDFIVLNRHLENLRAILDQADVYLA
jgi:hypothetical protein